MKRSRDYNSDEEEQALSVKRLKEPPSHDNIKQFVDKIHDALDGIALTTVQYPDDTPFCVFSIRSPPMTIEMEKINNLIDMEDIDFLLYKHKNPRTIALQVNTSNSESTLIEDDNCNDDKNILTIDGTEKEIKLMKWISSISQFKYTIERKGKKLLFIINGNNSHDHITKSFFKDLNHFNKILFSDYHVVLTNQQITLTITP